MRALAPAQAVVLGFAIVIAVGTGLLLLPVSAAAPDGASLVEALTTSTAAVCLTGMLVVDTATYWSAFGEVVILGLVQVGGIGIMTMTSLVGLLVAHRLGLRSRLNVAAESHAGGLGDVRAVVTGVVRTSLVIEAATAVALTARFALGYDHDWARSGWLGIFHAIAAFNNSGFALFSDSMVRFAADPWICVPLMVAVVLGGIGFPVLFELRRVMRTPRRWSLHTKLTLSVTGILLVVGPLAVLGLEWGNTLRGLDGGARVLTGVFQGVMPRTAGFHSVDYGEMDQATLLVTDVLMFIGGGSGGTAGGIKVTTFALLLFVILAEVRGERSVTIFDRRIGVPAQRQALAVALLAVAAVVGSTIVLTATTQFDLGPVLFEVVAAFSTAGLSTGITTDLPTGGQLLLAALMFIGRLGPVTLVSALARRYHVRMYELPEGRPLIG
ncbi:MAG TPA: potassium transporter TrkG [Jiangellaceae bacterium]|nr:potassium transporter TrkG [Jiangellaceae bacterium]